MSTSERFVSEYIGNPKFVDLLRAILDINYYEALSITAMALTNESSASRIADVTGIPRSKIYLTLSSLEQKKLVEKYREGYKLNESQIIRLQGITEELAKGFQKFIGKIATYSGVPSKTTIIILDSIKRILMKLGYHVSKPEIENIRRMYLRSRYAERIYYLESTAAHFDQERREEFLQKLRPSALKNIVEFIGESSTSGVKVSVVILTKEKLEEFGEAITPAIAIASDLFRCEASLVIIFPEVDLRKLGPESRRTESRIHVVSAYEADFEDKVSSILTELDRIWRESKRELDTIGSEIMELKRTLTSTLDATYKLNRDARNVEKYGERYQEILNRIETDLVTSDDLLSNIRNEYEHLSERLEAHRRFPSGSDIKDIRDKTLALRESVQRKIQAQDQLSEDLLSYLRGEKKYAEYGFSTNPFVFTVPPEYPEKLVDQKEAQQEVESFVENVIQGSSQNFLFLVADEGMGKTHTLNFFASKLNGGEFGNCIALRLICRPRSDIIDLYPQIQFSISRIKKEGISKEEIARILETSGVPKSITDFLRVLRDVNSHLITSGIKGVFLMIDDFENSLPSEETSITPRSVLQFRDLARLENIGFVVAIRENYWTTWHSEIGKRIPKSIKPNIVRLRKFTEEETLELLNHRLSEYQDLKAEKKPPLFTPEVVKRICKIAEGIPRQIIVIAREVFRIAVSEGKEITMDLLMEAAG